MIGPPHPHGFGESVVNLDLIFRLFNPTNESRHDGLQIQPRAFFSASGREFVLVMR